jgi:hypothetical protein
MFQSVNSFNGGRIKRKSDLLPALIPRRKGDGMDGLWRTHGYLLRLGFCGDKSAVSMEDRKLLAFISASRSFLRLVWMRFFRPSKSFSSFELSFPISRTFG